MGHPHPFLGRSASSASWHGQLLPVAILGRLVGRTPLTQMATGGGWWPGCRTLYPVGHCRTCSAGTMHCRGRLSPRAASAAALDGDWLDKGRSHACRAGGAHPSGAGRSHPSGAGGSHPSRQVYRIPPEQADCIPPPGLPTWPAGLDCPEAGQL